MYLCKVFINGEYKESFKDYCPNETKVWIMAKKYGCKIADVNIDYLRV